mgnify:FL=1
MNSHSRPHWLYILSSQTKHTYYIGSSEEPDRRLTYHNNESKGYTKRYRPWKIVYRQEFANKSQALRAERKVKNWKSKKMIAYLISGHIDIFDYL